MRWEQVRSSLAGRPLPVDMALSLLGSIADRLREDHLRGRAGGFDPAALTIVGDGVGAVGNPEALPVDQAYVAPELRTGRIPTPAGDAYAFAVFAHELLMGGRPSPGGIDARTMVARHPGFPSYAAEALTKALGSDPAARPLPRSLFTAFAAVADDRWPIPESGTTPETPAPAPDTVLPGDLLEPDQRTGVPAIDPLTEFIPENDHHGGQWVRASSRRGKRAKRASRTRRTQVVKSAQQAAQDAAPSSESDASGAAAPDLGDAAMPTGPVPAAQAPYAGSDVAETPLRQAARFDLPEVFRTPPPTRWTPERIQQVVLIAVILALIVAGILYALSRDGEPQYDPALQGQGASLSIVQPASVGR